MAELLSTKVYGNLDATGTITAPTISGTFVGTISGVLSGNINNSLVTTGTAYCNSLFVKSTSAKLNTSAWANHYLSNAAIFAAASLSGDYRIYILNNMYYDGSNWKYSTANKPAELINMVGGGIYFYYGPSLSHAADAVVGDLVNTHYFTYTSSSLTSLTSNRITVATLHISGTLTGITISAISAHASLTGLQGSADQYHVSANQYSWVTQDLRPTASPTFNNIQVTGTLTVATLNYVVQTTTCITENWTVTNATITNLLFTKGQEYLYNATISTTTATIDFTAGNFQTVTLTNTNTSNIIFTNFTAGTYSCNLGLEIKFSASALPPIRWWINDGSTTLTPLNGSPCLSSCSPTGSVLTDWLRTNLGVWAFVSATGT